MIVQDLAVKKGGGMAAAVMRKGPWMAEEDDILMEYVRQQGPRDWSSIRSKGLLPRTGKSCRLRWVNKLKPDLKTGCKFSAAEERVVIELQARFGNKWARIATYLPGRTDNDVKNFWSTRQKRLARILHAPPPGTAAAESHHRTIKGFDSDLIPFEEETSSGQCSGGATSSYTTQMPELTSEGLFDVDTTLPLLEPVIDRKPCLSHNNTHVSFDHLHSYPLLEGPNVNPGIGTVGFSEKFSGQNVAGHKFVPFPDVGLPFFGLPHGVRREDEHPETPDCFFNDFPVDMFDYLEPPLPASSAW